MQFIVMAYDGPGALERRIAARPAHIDSIAALKRQGKMLFATALLDDAAKMIGSVVVFDVADRSELDSILEKEPYVAEKVWEKIEIRECRVAPAFAGKQR